MKMFYKKFKNYYGTSLLKLSFLLLFCISFSAQVNAQTVLLSEDFETNTISTSTGFSCTGYPCSYSKGQEEPFDDAADCFGGNFAEVSVFSFSNNDGVNPVLEIGSFVATTTSVNIIYDYFYEESASISDMDVRLDNLSGGSDIVAFTHNLSGVGSTDNGTNSIVATGLVIGEEYELEFEYDAGSGEDAKAAIDNIIVTDGSSAATSAKFCTTNAGADVLMCIDFETGTFSDSGSNSTTCSNYVCSYNYSFPDNTERWSRTTSGPANQVGEVLDFDSFSGNGDDMEVNTGMNLGEFTANGDNVDVEFDYSYLIGYSTTHFRVDFINLSGGADVEVFVLDGSSGSDGTTLQGNFSSNITGLVSGNTYRVVVEYEQNDCSSSFCSDQDAKACFDNLLIKTSCLPAMASVTVDETNCDATYDLTIDVTDLGTSSSIDILVNGVLNQSVSATGMISLTGLTGGTATTIALDTDCGQVDLGSFAGCVNDICTEAIDIMTACGSGDLAVASDETNNPDGTFLGFSVGSGNSVAVCGGSYNSNYRFTDEVDLWYVMDVPDGATEFTVSFSGLTDRLMVVPYYGSCGSLTGFPLTTSGDVTVSTGEPFAVPDGSGNASITFSDNTGSLIATNSTSPFYIRILATTSMPSPGNSDCSNIVYPSFTEICGTAPQANDVCTNAVNITLNNLDDPGVTSTGNFNDAANEGNSIDCAGSAVAGGDLWYEVTYPDYPSIVQDFYTEVSFSGTAGDQFIMNVFDVTAACGSAGDPADMDYCETITIGADGTYTSDWGGLVSTDNQSREVQIIGIGTTSPLTVSANVVFENNTCSHFQNVLPGYDITNPLPVTFNYSTDSGADPVTAGNDLWFTFDPNSGNDGYAITYSTSADITVSGLTGDQEITIITYQGDSPAAGNCADLAGTMLSTYTVSNDGTFNQAISCLDENHGGAGVDGGYLVRIIQTAGSTLADPTVTITPGPAGPSNNSYDNVCSGGSPSIGPTDNPNSDAGHNWNQYWLQAGDLLTGESFVGANDCTYDATCSGVDFEAISEINDRDLWYVFYVPPNECATKGLTESTVIDNMAITYDAGDQTHDGVAYVYDACDPTNLLTCSGSLDGEGQTWNASGLTQGEYYLLRIKPWDISSTPTDWTFDIGVDNGVARPCNDSKENAHELEVNDCPDYPSLETFTMKGADDEEDFGTYDVWFEFTAPADTIFEADGVTVKEVLGNGNDVYFLPNKSWVSVFFEGVSAHSYRIRLYQEGGTAIATGASEYTTSGAGDRVWCKFGHLEPGHKYVIRLQATGISESAINTTEVQYKIEINAEGDVTPWGCGEFVDNGLAEICGSCGDVPYQSAQTENTNADESLCEKWYKIDLPPGTPGNMYWVVEVRGFDQVLDFELRSQYLTETSANEGGADDYDHPCSSRPLESTAEFRTSHKVGYAVSPGGVYTHWGASGSDDIIEPLDARSCEPLGGLGEPQAGGFRKVYRSLNGPAAGMKDFYYLRVFMDKDDPQYTDCAINGTTGINVCSVIFKGPYLDEVESAPGAQDGAFYGGAPEERFCTKFDFCDLSSNTYAPVFAFYTDANPEDGVPDQGVYLGNTIDSENDSWGTGASISDDTNGDDEDGLQVIIGGSPGGNSLIRTIGNSITSGKTVHNSMWIDWGTGGTGDGDFDGAFYSGTGVTASPVNIDFTVPVPATYSDGDEVFIRLSASESARLATDYDNDVENGEIEGHRFTPSSGSIAGTLFLDNYADGTEGNNNGDNTGTDLGLQGYTVTVTFCGPDNDCSATDDNATLTTTTDASGNYLFDRVIDGDYTITFTAPDYDEFTTQDTGSDDTIDSDATGGSTSSGGLTGEVTVTGGSDVTNVDAGVYDYININGTLYSDTDLTVIAPNTTATIAIEYCTNADCTTTSIVNVSITSGADGTFSIDDSHQLPPGRILSINSTYGNIEGPSVVNSETNAPSGSVINLQNFGLPVELVKFYATEAREANILHWTTATEENSSHFEVESSTDGTTFRKIGLVRAAGYSTEQINYSLEHTNPSNLTYYRLKITDLDASFEYSNTITVTRKTAVGIDIKKILPVPTSGLFEVVFDYKTGRNAEITITNVSGQVIATRNIVTNDSNTIEFDLSDQSGGVYFISIVSDAYRATERVIIAK